MDITRTNTGVYAIVDLDEAELLDLKEGVQDLIKKYERRVQEYKMKEARGDLYPSGQRYTASEDLTYCYMRLSKLNELIFDIEILNL